MSTSRSKKNKSPQLEERMERPIQMVNHRLPSFDIPVQAVDRFDESPLLDEDYLVEAK